VKLIAVRPTAVETYERLSRMFADVQNVQVVWDQRTRDRRNRTSGWSAAERRSHDRRRFTKPWNHLGYFVIHTAEKSGAEPAAPRPPMDPTHATFHKLAQAISVPLASLLDFGALA
jgi:hypothetical protein